MILDAVDQRLRVFDANAEGEGLCFDADLFLYIRVRRYPGAVAGGRYECIG